MNLGTIINNNSTNTSNYINSNFINTSNYIKNNDLNLSNLCINNNTYTSNYIKTNDLNISNLCLNIITNTSNYTHKTSVLLPSSKFWYDAPNALYCYDLNIEQYVKSTILPNNYKSRVFNISTYVPIADWKGGWNLYNNNQYINHPETLTIYMNNNSNVNGFSIANDTYINGVILGKTVNTNIGYWNLLPKNYNYRRYLSVIGWDTTVIIENLNSY
jgi:hypothetical protein